MARIKKSSTSVTNQFSFWNRENMKNYIQVQKAQFQDYITLYGVEVEYFSRNLDYYDKNGRVKNLFDEYGELNQDIRDFTYFNGPERNEFGIVMPMKCLIDYGTDNFMFTGFGLDMTNEGKFYITKEQFNQNCLQYFGKPRMSTVSIKFPFQIKDWKNKITDSIILPFKVEKKSLNLLGSSDNEILVGPDGDFIMGTDFDADNFQTYTTTIELPAFDADRTGLVEEFTVDNLKEFGFPTSNINPRFSTVYQANEFIELDQEGASLEIVSSKIDKKGKGYGLLELKFTISYNVFESNDGPHYDTLTTDIDDKEVPITFAPKVGDFIRLRMLDNPEVFRDYKIQFVNDADFSKDNISPYITSFVWECSINRRSPSHEEVPEGNLPQEKGLESIIDNKEQTIVQDITREKEVYDYQEKTTTDEEGNTIENLDYGKDAVYGGVQDADQLLKEFGLQ